MIKWVQNQLMQLVKKEKSSHTLALSFSVGAYVAFSPFIGLHTVMVLFLAWAFRLNFSATFAGSLLINNPWTMIPVYSAGYFFGDWLSLSVLGTNLMSANPSWMSIINEPLVSYIGMSSISLWSFMLGGNLLGVIIAVILYPVMRRVFAHLIAADQRGLVPHPKAGYGKKASMARMSEG